MEINFFQKNLAKNEEKLFSDYVRKKAMSIEQFLSRFSNDAQLLRASIEKFDKHDAYEVEFCLNLPGKSILAKEASHKINKATDLSKDRLIAQIKKHLAHLRKERAHRSIRDPHASEVLKFSEATAA